MKKPPLSHDATYTSKRSGSYKRILTTPALILFGLAYMVPLTVFTTIGYVSELSHGHVATAYVVTLSAMLFTALSYAAMVRTQPSSGSAYAYVRSSFGARTGFVVGWTLMLDYILLPMICYLFFGIYMHEYLPTVPTAVWIIGSVVVVTGLNILGIRLVSRMNLILVGVQIIFIIVFASASIRTMNGQEIPSPISPFLNGDMPFAGIMAGAAMLCLSFLGFDAVSTLSEEAKNPRRSIPKAIVLCTLIGGGMFIVIAYIAQMVFPSFRFANVDAASLEIMQHAGGQWLSALFTACYCAGLFACAMASQASVSRIIYAMGRDGALPRNFFGTLGARFGTPVNATLVSGLFGLTALFIDGDLATSVISFGALTAFSFVNLSVIKHHIVDRRMHSFADWLRFGLLPAIGVVLTLWLWTQLSAHTFAIGFCWVVVGVIWLAVLTRMFRKPMPEIRLTDAEESEVDTEDAESVSAPTTQHQS
ncbi:amino acid/polyamine/organocation transporter (APC superfamily) [Brevibacterium sanguinis]|uniref:Amino acid/polyamine/organocation transporter (APC superfamily) n=2 Tax=Brevibacterium TaxID=1696 RepID=A0A366IN39_9MICO|nr:MULTISPECIES: APC family permease [Brevibacterium]RBP68089.1 amino acid/polyamine/organocation transporter (APC superfamily) [Brevibacterium sanguinis]RBP74494.1 amino acid/polyamine/organocation transporter (APC superfamily) [Brevibacterium celere]